MVLVLKANDHAERGESMKSSIPFLFVCIASMSGCAVNTGEGEDADVISDVSDVSDVTDSPEPVASAAEASTLFGVNVIPSCVPGPVGSSTAFSVWIEVYGSFANNGNNVTAKVEAVFGNEKHGLNLSYTGSNYRSGSQVNLLYSGSSTSGCPTRYQGWVFDGGLPGGTF
jgi:hypothetical protein